MLRIFFVLFITLPLAELYVLIKVGGTIGGLPTIGLCLLTAAAGGLLIRWQGMNTLIDAQRRFARGELPAEHGLHGLMIALAGIFLFTPGFITDTLGFLLLIPPLRKLIIQRFLPQIAARRQTDVIDIEVIHDEHHLP